MIKFQREEILFTPFLSKQYIIGNSFQDTDNVQYSKIKSNKEIILHLKMKTHRNCTLICYNNFFSNLKSL